MITSEEYEDLLSKLFRYEGISCSCHCGNPPCSRCVDGLSPEDIKAMKEYEKENNL